MLFLFAEEGVVVEVDRFDPGRAGRDGSIVPTALMPGDVAVPCQVSQTHTVSHHTYLILSFAGY